MKKIISLLLCLSFLFQQVGLAQTVGQMNLSGAFSRMSNPVTQANFRPLHLRYFSYDSAKSSFNLLLDKGDRKEIAGTAFNAEAQEVFKYFLIGLSLPNSSFWVNLRPDSQEEIIDRYLEKTDMGRVLLEADLQLKKDTALFTSPQNAKGKQYWDKLYKKAGELFGQESISIPTLTRPWIVPGEVIIRYGEKSAYIYKANLKVMLEQDYLKDSSVYNFKDPRLKALNEYSSQLIRELIIPELTQEVNTAQRYAGLRQVYYSLILAQWFKQKFNNNKSAYARMVDRRDINNLLAQFPWSKQVYFKAYQKSFNDGEYNIKEPVATPFGQVIRSYFSGGVAVQNAAGGANFSALPATGSALAAGEKGFEAALEQGANFTGVRVGDSGEVLPIASGPQAPPRTLPNNTGNTAGSAGFEGLPDEAFNGDIALAVRPQRKHSFARKFTIPYARPNAVYRTAEGRRNVKQHMRNVLDRVEENVLTVVFGKEFEGGKQVVKRGSADANLGWTDEIRELDPDGAKYLMAQEEYTQKGFEALMQGNYAAFANFTNLYVKSRSDTSRRWLSLMLQARKGARGLPRWVYEVYAMIMDNPKEYENFIHLFDDIDQGISPADYDLYAPGEIGIAMQAALEFNQLHTAEGKAVGVFALGAGGAGSVCALVGTSRQVALEFLQFLREQRGIVVPRLLTTSEAARAPAAEVITTTEIEQLTTGAAGTKYATDKHRLAFWVSAKADVDGVKINLDQWNEAPVLKTKGLTLETPVDLPWVLVNKNTLEVWPIEQVVDGEGNVRPEFSEAEWIVAKNWDLGFDHTKYFRLDRPILAEENMKFIGERIARNGFQGVFSGLWAWAKANDKKIFISVPARWLDIIGSSWDLKDFRLYGTPEGDLRLELLPACNAIPSEYRLEIEISAINDPGILEYVAPQYFQGVHRVNPSKIEHLQQGQQPQDAEALLFVPHANPALAAQGIEILQRKERDVPALFARLFGVKGGLRLTVQKMDIVPRQGGMESGNAQADLVVAAFSMLSGAKFSVAEVSYISHVAQMNETNTLTGNQGADAAWAGAGLHVYLGGLYDMDAPRNFAAVKISKNGTATQAPLQYETEHPVWGINNYSVPVNKAQKKQQGVFAEQAIKLTAEQLRVLEGALRRLPSAAQNLLREENTLIFLSFGEGKTASRSLGRNQIEVDLSLLGTGQEYALAQRLWHEVTERDTILGALWDLGLEDEFNKTRLNPRARQTTFVTVAGQKVILQEVINHLASVVDEALMNPEVSGRFLTSPAEIMATGLPAQNFIGLNLARALLGNPPAADAELVGLLAAKGITQDQLDRAALRVKFALTALTGVDISGAGVGLKLEDIHPEFRAVQDDLRLFTQGGLPGRGSRRNPKFLDPDTGIDQDLAERAASMPQAETALPASGAAPVSPGGIDFRSIHMLGQARLEGLKANFKIPELKALRALDLAKERRQLNNLMQAKIVPSSQRMMEYISACYLRANRPQDTEEALVCLVDYFRLQEESLVETNPEFKVFLAVIESGKPVG